MMNFIGIYILSIILYWLIIRYAIKTGIYSKPLAIMLIVNFIPLLNIATSIVILAEICIKTNKFQKLVNKIYGVNK